MAEIENNNNIKNESNKRRIMIVADEPDITSS
jgi:hypothetical protein